jgi:hypothetical protein
MKGAFVGDTATDGTCVSAEDSDGWEIVELPGPVTFPGVIDSCEGTKRVTETVFSGDTGVLPDVPLPAPEYIAE